MVRHFFISLCILFFTYSSLIAATHKVKSGQNLQAILKKAKSGDTIKVAAGTFNGPFNINGKSIKLLGSFDKGFKKQDREKHPTHLNGGAAVTHFQKSPKSVLDHFVISGGQRGVLIDKGCDGFTLSNCLIENNRGITNEYLTGGGVRFDSQSVTIKNNIIRNNDCGRGGGIANAGGAIKDFLIESNLVENNTCVSDHGAGLYIFGKGKINNNIIQGNKVGKSWGWGGGIIIMGYGQAEVYLQGNIYRDNVAGGRGAGVFVDDEAKAYFKNELFYNNKSKGNKPGTAFFADRYQHGQRSYAELENCTIIGGAYANESTIIFKNCIFWDSNGQNFSVTSGGKIELEYTLHQQKWEGKNCIQGDPLFAGENDFHLQSKKGRFDSNKNKWVKDKKNSPAIDAGDPKSDHKNEGKKGGKRINLGVYGNTAEASQSK